MYIGQSPPSVALTSSDIADGIISNAKLAQDIISADTALGAEPADTDELLVSDAGTLKRMDYSHIKGGGDLVKLAFTTVSSGIATVDLADFVDESVYQKYFISWSLAIPAVNTNTYRVRFLDSSDNAITDSTYNHTWQVSSKQLNTSTTADTNAQQNDNAYLAVSHTAAIADVAAEGGSNGNMWLTTNSTSFVHGHQHSYAFSSNDYYYNANGVFFYEGGTAVHGIQFLASGGNTDSGKFGVYGLKI